MKKTFEVGTRVVLVERSNLETYDPNEDDTTRGVVEALGEEGKFVVRWDDSWITPNPTSHDADELITEAKAEKILSKLEKEYEAWAAPIRKKIEKAAQLLREAGELAEEGSDDSLAEMYELVGPLIGAMRDLGWRTSSLNC